MHGLSPLWPASLEGTEVSTTLEIAHIHKKQMLELLVVNIVRLLYCTVFSVLQKMSLLEFCSQRFTAVISWWEGSGGKCEKDRKLCPQGRVLMEELR